MNKAFIVLVLLAVALASPLALTAHAQEANETGNATLESIVGAAASNPRMAAVMFIEFLLGVALGYLAVKVIRYILAFIGILILGSVLSAWSLGGNPEEMAKQLGVEAKELAPALKQFIMAIGATIVGPASIGVIVGVILAMVRK